MQEEKAGFGKRLSNLFAGRQNETEPGPETARPAEPPPAAPADEAVAAPQLRFTPHAMIELSKDGPTWALWTLRNQGEQSCREPILVLDAMPEEKPLLLSGEQLESEVMRLRINVEVKTGNRLKLVREQMKRTEGTANLNTEYLIHIAQSGMMAWMFVLPPLGDGQGAGTDSALAAVRRAGINTGVDEEIIAKHVEGERYLELFPIAWGTPPEEGEDGRVVEHYPREAVRQMMTDQYGNVDYREQNYVRTIQKDDVICDILPPRPGVDGIQVTGKPIKARPVQPARAPSGKNTTVTPDGTRLVASVAGHLDYSGKVFLIKSVLDIPGDVDYATGNINVFGDVHVGGDVRENFTVRATGDITVDGLVEGATLEADGNVVITKGVLGDNKAVIRSRKTVRAKYLENCEVYASDSVYADCIISSRVYCDNMVSVVTGRGTIIGGCISAANLVEVSVLGTKAGRRSEVVLGRFPNVERERVSGAADLELLEREVADIDKQIFALELRESSLEGAKLLGKLRLSRSVQNLKLEKLTNRLGELEGMEPDIAGCRLRCGQIYPVVNLTIGRNTRRITEEWVNSTVYYDLEYREITFT